MKQQAKEYYENNRISLIDLSRKSLQLFGQHISYDSLKHWASEENWLKPPAPPDERRRIIADKIFELIEDVDMEDASVEEMKLFLQAGKLYLDFTIKAPDVSSNRPTMQDILSELQKL